uniref:Uncharacterized protein n=1 Tax=Canis lupus familiaris TaxID=9615 RepID=A0A8I3Q9U1_CANLF
KPRTHSLVHSFLLWHRSVKQIMEEAVTRKFVHEDSSHIISFCGESVACGLESGFFLYGLT